jgi:hypothetical protein
MDVDAALSEVPVNILPLIDDTDFKTIEDAIAYNQAGMDLTWNFVTTAGAFTSTAVTPTTAGDYDWNEHTADDGMYTLEIPASGGASINNDTEGFGWFTGVCTGVLPWRGPVIGFRAAGINNALVDSAWSATRGLTGTAVPDAAANAAGGLPVSAGGSLALDTKLANTNEVTAARMGALTDWIDGGRLDVLLDAIPTTAMRGTDNASTHDAAAVLAAIQAAGTHLTLIKAVTDVIPDAGALTTIAADAARLTAARAAVLTDWIDAGRLDTILDTIASLSASSAAWGSINSGIVFRGAVSAADPGVSFTIGGLAGQGVGAFIDAATPWYAYVFRDAGGAAAAPQGEQKLVTGYTSATGLFTTEAFTTPVAVGDDVIIMSGRIAAIPEIKAVTDALPDAGALTTIGTDTARLTAARAGALTDWINGGRLDLLLDAVKAVTDALTAAAAAKLALSAGQMVTGTVSHDNTAATTTVFYCDDITEATADHYKSRLVYFTSGALAGQFTDITAYALVSGEGKFTVTALTEAPADNVTLIIV